jgi:hypothetical protein
MVVIAFLMITLTVIVSRQGQNLLSFAANTTYIAGVMTKGSTMDSGNQNGISATQVTTGSNAGVLTSITVYVGSVNSAPLNHMQVAIYADNGANKPGSLLTASNTQALQAKSWNTFTLNNVVINANTNYWLAFNVDGRNTQYAIGSARSPKAAWRIPTLYGSWPGSFGTSTQPLNKEQYSLYMTYSSIGDTLPTPLPTMTPVPTDQPTMVPSPQPTGAPWPTGTGARGCPLPDYPRPDCVGVPAGTQLTDLPLNNGDEYLVSNDGAIIENKHISGDLRIKANNVVVKNSQIDGTILNDIASASYHSTIEDSTIGPAGGCIVSPGIDTLKDLGNYTALRVSIRGHDDGFRAGGPNITIRDSYVKNCGTPDSHGDGIQDYPVTSNLVLDHNTLDLCGAWTTDRNQPLPCNVPGHNSPIFINSPTGSTNVSITNNLALGGVYSLYTHPYGNSWTIKGNRIVDHTWDYGSYETGGYCANVKTWNDNTIVTIDTNYHITATLSTAACPQ